MELLRPAILSRHGVSLTRAPVRECTCRWNRRNSGGERGVHGLFSLEKGGFHEQTCEAMQARAVRESLDLTSVTINVVVFHQQGFVG